MENNNDWIVFDGDIVPAEKPVVPAHSRGLMYGDGVFETFRVYEGRTFFLQEHLQRLKYGCEILGISKEPPISFDAFRPLLKKLLQKRDLHAQNSIVRMQVWREGKRGYQTDINAEMHYTINASYCPEEFSCPKLIAVDRRRIPSEALPSDVKFTNGINYILAAQEASKKGGDDALMQTVNGWISETTIANIFWINDNTIFTPSVECDLIPGITRDIVLQIIKKESSWEVRQDKFKVNHIFDADAAWICNSVREILPVQQIDGHHLNVEHELLKELQNRYLSFRDANLKALDS